MSEQAKERIFYYLNMMAKEGASDFFLTVGVPGTLKIQQSFKKINEPVHTADTVANIVREFLTEEQWMEFTSILELNVALATEDGERYRVNIFYNMRTIGLVARHIKSKIPSHKELGLPDVVQKFIMQKRGLFLVVGPTGSGKSTTISSMIEYRNLYGEGHIVTIEDPIEFVFKHKNCIFTQREINIDTYSYNIALKNALRQAPDVLFIGEIRDRESMEAAIMFSETGHLVIATVHGNNTHQAFERILTFYPEENYHQVMTMLSHNLNGIIGQRLVKSVHGNLVLAYEVLVNEGLIKELVKEGKFGSIKEVMQQNLDNGMITFDECLYKLFKNKMITKETAIKEADNPNNVRLRLSQYSDSNLSKSISNVKTNAAESHTLGSGNKDSNF